MFVTSAVRVVSILAGSAALVLGLQAAASAACATTGTQYANSFAKRDPDWDSSDVSKMAGGKLAFSIKKNLQTALFYRGAEFSAGTICMDVAMSDSAGKDPAAGIVFDAIDDKNYYQFLINPANKHVAIMQYQDGHLYSVVAWKASPGFAASPTDVNEVSVTVRDGSVYGLVNGVEAAYATLDRGPKTWMTGVDAESSTALPASWTVTNFSVAP